MKAHYPLSNIAIMSVSFIVIIVFLEVTEGLFMLLWLLKWSTINFLLFFLFYRYFYKKKTALQMLAEHYDKDYTCDITVKGILF
jgi:hypothetical protein